MFFKQNKFQPVVINYDISGTTTTTTPTPTCDTSNTYHRLSYDNTRFCIKIHNAPLEWGAARRACMSEHADLVVLDSHDKYAAMTSHLRNVYIDHSGKKLYPFYYH